MKKSERSARWEKCQEYIRRTTTLDEAMKLGKAEGFAAPTSAWINAFGKILAKGSPRVPEQPRLLTERELNTIRGKCLVGHQSRDEMLSVFQHYDLVETALDDALEDWRGRVGLPDAED